MKSCKTGRVTALWGSLGALLLIAGAAQGAPLYEGYHHGILNHVMASPNGLQTTRAGLVTRQAQKSYGPGTIAGTRLPAITIDTINQLPATAAGNRKSLLTSPRDYGIRPSPRP
ncbi:MAG: hypothetical protein R3208_15885 [Ketobacteraceae bacterium]|nr:hypothetical protein [Ketobacteraceae bacterium]